MTAAGVACGSCGTGLRGNANFCDECGAPIAVDGAKYKQVTVLFADVVRSMDIATAVDIERLREIMTDLVERSAAVVQRYGGTVEYTGDGVMALFGAPVALEDHAFRGCLAALAIQEEADRLAAEVQRRDGVTLRLRVGLNSGQVIAGEIGSGSLGYAATGEAVGFAQRMESVAPPGGVLVSESTARLVEHLVVLAEPERVRIKGADEPVLVRQLLAIQPRERSVGRTDASLVGRRWEMATLDAVLDRSLSGRGGVVGVVGPPGIGKSRAAREAAALAAERGVAVSWAFCESHAGDIAFGLLARILRAATRLADLGDDATARARLREYAPGADPQDLLLLDDLLGIADPDAPLPQIDPEGRRRRLTALINTASLARTEPALYVIEDAHWIDAASESMLADLLTVIPRTTSMVLITYRPDYTGLLTRLPGAQTIALVPLGDSDITALLGELLGAHRSVEELATIIADRAAGNPFFAEEMVRELVQRGVLTGERGGYTCHTDVAEVSVPATVQAAIAARIDRLSAPAKQTLTAASVIGAHFGVDLLTALGVDPALDELLRAEIIDQVRFTPYAEYAFRHALIRAVAYESQLKSDRAEWHRRLAVAIQESAPGSAEENAALIAEHLQAAGELHAAYRWHMRAGEWLRRRDLTAARAQWENARRVADLLPDELPDEQVNRDTAIAMRVAPRTMLMSTMLYVRDDVDADARYREFRDLAIQTGDLKSLAIGMAGRIWSFGANRVRVPEAAALAVEIEEIVGNTECDPESTSIILNAAAYARFVNCEFDSALRDIDAILALNHDAPAAEVAAAYALRGVIEMCLGDYERGYRDLRVGTDQARDLHPVRFAAVLHYSGILVALGMCIAADVMDDARDALRRAEAFGDVFGIVGAQWVYGTTLLREEHSAHGEAIDVLEHARAGMQKEYSFQTVGLATISADLAVEAARRGRCDEAIADLRAAVSLHAGSGSRVVVGCPAEALVGLLIDRGSTADLTEARQIVDEWQAHRPDIPALDLWWLKSCARLAEAEGRTGGYADWATQYLQLCEKLDARGRLAEARQMVTASVAQPRTG